MAAGLKKAASGPGKLAEAAAPASLAVSAQILNFEPGTYTIELGAQDVRVGPGGFKTPSVRVDTLHQPGTARAFFSALAETSLLAPGEPAAFIRVTGTGSVAVLLTIYRFENMPAPEIRVRLLEQPAAMPGPQAPPQPQDAAVPDALPHASLLLHIEGVGDSAVPLGSWGGTPGSGRTIEGFALRTEASGPKARLEYQAALGLEWDTPWFPAGEFCGSRGMMLPLLGVRLRVLEEDAGQLVCRYWGSFVGVGEKGPFEQGELCASDGLPLEALRVELVPPERPRRMAEARRKLLGRNG